MLYLGSCVAEAVSRALDALNLDHCVDRDPDPLGFAVQQGYCIGIHIGKQPWQAKPTR
jgi:hypothetical protein